jgi:hypothetical protein
MATVAVEINHIDRQVREMMTVKPMEGVTAPFVTLPAAEIVGPERLIRKGSRRPPVRKDVAQPAGGGPPQNGPPHEKISANTIRYLRFQRVPVLPAMRMYRQMSLFNCG